MVIRYNKTIKKNQQLRKKRQKKTQNKKTKKNIQCSPKRNSLNFTCYSQRSLHRLKKFWNARHPDILIKTNDNVEIWKQLNNNLSNICNNEKCWLQQKFIKNHLDRELLNYTFAPDAPETWKKNPNTWLNSLDIENVMIQYEKVYPNFEFIGPSPIDFDTKKLYGSCVWDELCKFKLSEKIKHGINKIGVVFNTDPHYEPGEHWIALFIDIKHKYIFFFNSTGEKILPEINRLVRRIIAQGKELDIKLRFIQNHPFVHQTSKTECGIYVLYTIIELLKESKTPEYFLKHRVHDRDMEKLRKIYFN